MFLTKKSAIQVASTHRLFGNVPATLEVVQYGHYAEVIEPANEAWLRDIFVHKISKFEMDAFDRECEEAMEGY